ncbi:MAG TPA: hypothetical protein VK629_19555 [Steroidobacteraceae bacterium]|nr:hypothetical protein [Steroidobacteraceae bacterium]
MRRRLGNLTAWSRALVVMGALVGVTVEVTLAAGQAPLTPVVQPAIDGVLAAFATHPIVAIGDQHGLAQQLDFYNALIREPRFARDVGNVVVEFGTAQHQGIIDRYVNGEDVPYSDLRKVWSDAVGWTPFATFIGFANVFAQIRAANANLPPQRRIKVWLGDPPIDWSSVTSGAEVFAIIGQRDSFPAELIRREILEKDRKTLVIYGAPHVARTSDNDGHSFSLRTPRTNSEAALRKVLADLAKGAPDYIAMNPAWATYMRRMQEPLVANVAVRGAVTAVTFVAGDDWSRDVYAVKFAGGTTLDVKIKLDDEGRLTELTPPFPGFSLSTTMNLRENIESFRPNAVFYIQPYTGPRTRSCAETIERAFNGWQIPALVIGTRGSALEREIVRPDCAYRAPFNINDLPFIPPAEMSALRSGMIAAGERLTSGLAADAILYLGPSAELTVSSVMPDLYLDDAFRREIARRQTIKGQPLSPLAMRDHTTAPRSLKAYDAPPPPAPSESQRLAAFEASDQDRNGLLDRMEYWHALRALGFEEQLDSLFTQRDHNRDFVISAEEYRGSVSRQ